MLCATCGCPEIDHLGLTCDCGACDGFVPDDGLEETAGPTFTVGETYTVGVERTPDLLGLFAGA